MSNENKIDYSLLEKARVMIFAAHGAPVELQPGCGWDAHDSPAWNFAWCDYRIRPNWLNVPEGYELVPLGEAVAGRCKLRLYDSASWCSIERARNIDLGAFVARPITKPEPRLQLQEGKWYRRRDGEVVGPLTKAFSTHPDARPFAINCLAYNPDGSWNDPGEGASKNDLIEEVPAPEPRKVPLTPDDIRARALAGKPMYYEYEDGHEKCTKLCQSFHSPVTGENLLRKQAKWIDGTPCWKEDER